MTDYRDPKTGKRTAVLRPEDPKKSLARLAEWNALMDEAEADGKPELRYDADRLWKTMKREQGWRFVGWLLTNTKQTSGGPAAPGDLHINETEYEKDFRP